MNASLHTESEFDREKSVQIGHDLDLLADDKYGQHASVDEGEQTEKIQPQDLQAAAIQGSCIFSLGLAGLIW